MNIKINNKPSFKVLANGTNFEVRIYPPTKRTVKIVGRNYFLQFPYVIFGKYSGRNKEGNIGSWLHVAFVHRKLTRNSLAKTVYFPPLGNIYEYGWVVCLDGGKAGHYRQKSNKFEDLIYKFWNHEFSEPYATSSLGKRYHEWQKMSLDKVLKAVSKIERKMSLSNFIATVKKGEGDSF